MLIPIAIVGALFLWPLVSGARRYPPGFDTTKYIFRANAVAADGLDSLDDITPPSLRLGTNPDRPGYPVIASLAGSVLGVDAVGFAMVTPAVMAVAVALGAGAFAVVLLRQPGWAFPLFAIGTGASILVARTAIGSADNLIVDSIVFALFACAIGFADRLPGFAGALLLSAGATLVHWNFAVIALALLGGVAVVFAIPSLLQVRDGRSWWETPAPRLAAVIGGSVAVGAASLLVAPAPPQKLPKVPIAKIELKNAKRLPGLRLPVWAAASTAGGVVAWFSADHRRRMTTVLLIGWGATPIAATLLFRAGENVPPYRFATFALALPMLATLLVTSPGTLVAGRRPVLGVLIGITLGGASVAWATAWTADYWWNQPSIPEDQFDQSLTAGRYLASIGEERPVVFITSLPKITLPDHLIRGGVPPSFVDDVYLFPGSLEELRILQEDPEAEVLSPTFNRRGLAARALVADLLAEEPIVLFLSAFNVDAPVPKGLEVQPGVLVVEGPPPIGVEPPAPPRRVGIVLDALALASLLMLVGVGWSAALAPGGLLTQGGLAMAFGLAVLAVGGTVADRLGLPLRGAPATGLVVALALGGWVVMVAGHLRRRRWPAASASADARPEDVDDRTDGAVTPG
jgi:hypothetical protein